VRVLQFVHSVGWLELVLELLLEPAPELLLFDTGGPVVDAAGLVRCDDRACVKVVID
jgi:hypothetical protein